MQQDFEVAVDAAETTEALWKAFGDYFHGSAVKRLTYLHLPPLGALDDRRPDMKSHGVPDEAIEQYLAGRHYRDNPILQRAQRSAEPVYWDEIDDMVLSAEREATSSRSSRRSACATASASRPMARTGGGGSSGWDSVAMSGGWTGRCSRTIAGSAS